MGRNRFKRLSFVLAVLLILSVCFAGTAFGASARASISGGGTYKVGSTVTVNFSYSGATFGTSKTTFSYDTSVLQFKGCSAVSGGTSGVTTVSMASGGSSSLSCTLTFKVVGTGSARVSASTNELYNIDGEALTASTTSTTISGKSQSAQKSGNANLSYLSASAGSLSPAFSPSVTSYTVNVGNDTTVCTLSANPENSKAKISVSGSMNLSVGRNVRTVIVTAENGATKKYTVTINRAASSGGSQTPEETDKPEVDNPEKDDPEEEEPSEISVKVGDKEYTVVETYDEGSVPKGFATTVAKYDEKQIPAVADDELKYIMVLLKDKDTGDEKWFFYDEEKETFSGTAQITPEEVIAEYGEQNAEKPAEKESVFGNTEKVLLFVIGGTLVILATAIILLQVSIVKGGKGRSGSKKVKKSSKVKISLEEPDESNLQPEESVDEIKKETKEDIDDETGSDMEKTADSGEEARVDNKEE